MLFLRYHGRHNGRLVLSDPQFQSPGFFHQFLNESLVNLVEDDGARSGGALLSRVGECPAHRQGCGLLEIAIRQDQDGILSPHLQLALHTPFTRPSCDTPADRVRTREGNTVYLLVPDHLCAESTTPSRDEIDDAGRNSGLLKNLRNEHAAVGRDACGFQDYGVAVNQRRRNFPDRNCDRKIPGRDDAHYAERRASCVYEGIRIDGRHHFADAAKSFGGIVTEQRDAARGFPSSFGDGLAVFPHHRLRHILQLRLENVCGLAQELPTSPSRQLPPLWKRAMRRVDGPAYIIQIRRSEFTDNVTGIRWID